MRIRRNRSPNANIPMQLSYATSPIIDSAGFERQLVHVYDESGVQVASVMFKGRDELPEYSILRGSGPVTHLGERPRLGPAAESGAYDAWQPGGAGSGVPHYIVDSSPLGIVELAMRLGGDERVAALGAGMRNGVWPDSALKVADAMFAMTQLADETIAAVDQARAIWREHIAQQLEYGAIAFDAILRREITPEVAALEQSAPRYLASVKHWLTEGKPEPEWIRDHWLARLEELRADGRVDELYGEITEAGHSGSELGAPFRYGHRMGQIQMVMLEGIRSDGWFANGGASYDRKVLTYASQWVQAFTDPTKVVTVAAALAGDGDARAQVHHALQRLEAHDTYLQEQHALKIRGGRGWPSSDQAFAPEDLAVVHTTSFAPERDGNGAVVLHPLFDATGYSRSSLHFTLNHGVVSHLYSNWADAGYVVIGRYPDVVAQNGLPENLFGVDTWWARNPGAPVRIPGAIVISGRSDAPVLGERVGNEVYFKNSNFTADDLAQLEAVTKLDVAALEARLANNEQVYNVSPEKTLADRNKAVLEAARNYAVETVLRDLRVPIAKGSSDNSSIDGRVRPLAIASGLSSGMHCDAASHGAEAASTRYAQEVPEAWNTGQLQEASPAARRCAIAAGAIAPHTPRQIEHNYAAEFSGRVFG